ncbi:hypothetical protein H8E07_23005 [bacterium]|nr:hypothetical protein [bacterium]
MKKLAYGALALVLMMSIAGVAAAQTIDQIQQYDPVSGLPASPYDGTLVTVEGRIFVVNNTYNGGTHYILDDTGQGINFYFPGAPPLTYGDRVQVISNVHDYGGEIGVQQGTGDPAPQVNFLGNEAEPTPVVMTVDEVLNGLAPPAEDGYENVGKFVDVFGIVVSKSGDSNFYMRNVGATDTIQVYIDSTTLIGLGAVDIGDEYRVLSPVVTYNGEIELKPRKQGDLIEGTGPVIDDIELDDWSPLASEAVTVSATITDNVMVASATIYYRDDNGDSTGVFLSTPMSNTVGDTWTGIIPPFHSQRQVDFYIEAVDDEAYLAANPGDAPLGWHEFAVGFTPIYDIQYADPSQPLQGSSLYNKTVNINAIVSVGTGDAGSNSRFLVQDGVGAFHGILVYEGSSSNFVLAGDEVEIGGYVGDYYGLTEMIPHTAAAIEVVSFSNDLYPAVVLPSGVLNDDTLDDGDGVEGEAYESVWVTTFCSTVTDTTGYDPYTTFLISDTPGDTLIVDAGVDLVYMASPGDHIRVYGYMDYDFGNFELVPLQDDNLILDCSTAVEGELPQLESAGGFTRVAPNPFNPKTEIRFVLTRDNLTQLNIYNIRGELVRNLVSELLESGEHISYWDGRDLNGQRVSSGTYFARLRLGTEVMQMQKLMLVK